MRIALSSRLFLLGGLLLPVSLANANLNRGDSPLREIGPESRGGLHVSAPGVPLSIGFSANRLGVGHLESDGGKLSLDESNATKEEPGDEKYFGSATWSEVSKPRMVDFSFGQPAGPTSWWGSPEFDSRTIVSIETVSTFPKMAFEWGDLRHAETPRTGVPSASASLAFIPLSLLSVLGLTVRRTR